MNLFKIWGEVAIKTNDAIKELDNTADKAESTQTKMGSSFAKIGGAIAAAFSVSKIIEFGKFCVSAASDVQEMQNKFDVVFQGMTEDVESWASSFAGAIGRNSNAIKGYLADAQNMFVGMGMQRRASAELSEQMVSLALDLASFNNLEEDQAVNALTKALMGQSEAAKTLGAVLNENTLAQAQEILGYKGKFEALSEAEKMEVRYQAILMQSTDAIGDCARSVDSYKGAQIRLKSATENLTESIGAKLLPIVTKGVSVFADGAAWLTNNLEDVMFVGEELAAVLTSVLAGKAIMSVIASFQAAQVQIALYTAANGSAALASGVLSGALTAQEVIVGVLTGKISLATAAQYAWNAAISANPVGILLAGLAGLVLYSKKVVDSQKEMNAAEVGVAESMEEAAAKVEELKIKIAELHAEMDENIVDPDGLVMQQRAMNDLTVQLGIAEDQYNAFLEAEQAAAAEAADPANRFKEATETYAEEASNLMAKFQETYDGIYGKVSGWFQPFQKASVDVKTSIKDIMDGMQSQIDFNNDYTANLEYLKEAGLGSLSEALQAYGADGAAYAQTIVQAIEEAGGASTEAGKDIINGITDTYSGLEQSQGELTNSLTLMNGEFEANMQQIADNYAKSIEDLDKAEEAIEAGANTIQGLETGINSATPGVLARMRDLGNQMTQALQNSIGTINFTVNATLNKSGESIKSISGISLAPYRGVTASSAAQSAGEASSNNGITINQYISAIAQTPVELAAATQAYFQQARFAL